MNEKQIYSLIGKDKTANIKGFTINDKKADGYLEFDSNFNPKFIEETSEKKEKKIKEKKPFTCPKCGKGQMLKGNSAYGCSRFREDCKFVIPFELLQKDYNTTKITAKLLKEIALQQK